MRRWALDKIHIWWEVYILLYIIDESTTLMFDTKTTPPLGTYFPLPIPPLYTHPTYIHI